MAVRDKVHLRAVGWAITLLVGAMFILVGALEFPLLSGKPISSAQGLDGTQLVEIFLNRQCINTKCDRVIQVGTESGFLQAALTLIVFGSASAVLLCLVVLCMAVCYPHNHDLGHRFAGWDFKLTLLFMVFTSVVCFVGWLMIPLSFPELASACPANGTVRQIHCNLPCDNGGHMDYFVLCGPYLPGSGAFLIFVGMAFVFISPLFARWWVNRYENEYDESDGQVTDWGDDDDIQAAPESSTNTSRSADDPSAYRRR